MDRVLSSVNEEQWTYGVLKFVTLNRTKVICSVTTRKPVVWRSLLWLVTTQIFQTYFWCSHIYKHSCNHKIYNKNYESNNNYVEYLECIFWGSLSKSTMCLLPMWYLYFYFVQCTGIQLLVLFYAQKDHISWVQSCVSLPVKIRNNKSFDKGHFLFQMFEKA